MNSIDRREEIISVLQKNEQAVSASVLAEKFNVSRQIIVTDIALLRAKGEDILATPRGYILNSKACNKNHIFTVVCKHSDEMAKDELYAIVDNGAEILDVTVDHPIYGSLSGQLNISSRKGVDEFLKNVKSSSVPLLNHLTDGVHLHTISCKDRNMEVMIKWALDRIGVLVKTEDPD